MLFSTEVFCCYAREDQQHLHSLKTHLMSLQRQGLISIWNDTDISPGREWEREIIQHLNTAQIILLLVSPDFMNSDYCYGVEMKRAIERHEHGEATVIPIILRPVYWKEAPFGKLQSLPRNGKPITGVNWHSSDEALFTVTEEIRKAIEDTRKKATFKDKPGSGTKVSTSQQFNPSSQIPSDTTAYSLHIPAQTNLISSWRRPLIVLGSVSGSAITIIGVGGFFISFEEALSSSRSPSNGEPFGLALAGIFICIGAFIFCKSAVATVGRYIAGFSIMLAAILFITGFFLYDRAEALERRSSNQAA